MVVLKWAAIAGRVSPLWAIYSTNVPGGYASRVGSGVGEGSLISVGAIAVGVISVTAAGGIGEHATKSKTKAAAVMMYGLI